MKVPAELRYTKDHEWVRNEGDVVTIGITAFAQSELGEIVFVDPPAAGAEFSQREVFCVVESTKAASDVYAPLTGEIVEVNKALENDPTLINKDPYGKGWLVKMKLDAKDAGEMKALMDATAYEALVAGAKK